MSSSSQALLATYTDSRPYSSVVWLTSHNSFTNIQEVWIYAQQAMSLEQQFDYGVRSFMLDLHLHTRPQGTQEIVLCHQTCTDFSGGITSLKPPVRLINYLKKFHQFLVNNPNEITAVPVNYEYIQHV